jgi:hypothetical protein
VIPKEGEPTTLTIDKLIGPPLPPRDVRLRRFTVELASERGLSENAQFVLASYADKRFRIAEILHSPAGKDVVHMYHRDDGSVSRWSRTKDDHKKLKYEYLAEDAERVFEAELSHSPLLRQAARDTVEFIDQVFFG